MFENRFGFGFGRLMYNTVSVSGFENGKIGAKRETVDFKLKMPYFPQSSIPSLRASAIFACGNCPIGLI